LARSPVHASLVQGFAAIAFRDLLSKIHPEASALDMQRHLRLLAVAVATAAFVAGCATKPKPTQSVEQVMESGFKGKESLCAKVSKGEGSAADHQTMVDLTYQLTLNTPAKGDLASWTQKTTALHAAAKALAAQQPGALDAWKTASNCKACHSVHKPD
jgi:cytochrome c556